MDDLDAELARLHSESVALHRAGNSEAAQQTVTKAVQLVESTFGDRSPRLIPVLRLRAWVGSRSDAVRDLSRALAIAEEHELDASTRRGLYGPLGNALRQLGRLKEARENLERALEISVKQAVQDDMFFDLLALAQTVTDISPAEAAPMWERLVSIEARVNKHSHTYASLLSGWGDCLLRAGRAAEALETLREALSAFEALTGGAPHPWADEMRAKIAEAEAQISKV